jgi:hypothetical protein
MLVIQAITKDLISACPDLISSLISFSFMSICDRTQTGKGTDTRTLCQKIERSVEVQ